MNTFLAIALALSLAALGWVATTSEARIDTLEAQRSSAKDNADRWRTTATALQGRVYAQSTLTAECLQREADALADMTERQRIMTLAPPITITPDQRAFGVSRETRLAAAEYFNRPL